MKEFKGTPGAWIASDYYIDATTIIDGSGFEVAEAPRCIIREGWSNMGFQHWGESDEAHRWISEDEQRANANLIAASPELLSALQELLIDIRIAQGNMRDAAKKDKRWEGCAEAFQSRVYAADAAISKALGESQ